MKTKRPIESLILTQRNKKVILDADLAERYGVQTKRLNEAVKRNADRFPEDFLFRLTTDEWAEIQAEIGMEEIRSQFTTGSAGSKRSQMVTASQSAEGMRSQFATASKRNIRHLPFAFTEHGALQAANVLKSDRAAAMSVYVIRAFVQMREHILANADVLKRLAEIDQTLLQHDRSLQVIWQELQPLLSPPPSPAKPRIGFKP